MADANVTPTNRYWDTAAQRWVYPTWKIKYDNDTDPDDEGFWEWWEVTNGERTFKAGKEEDAEWLCNLLNLADAK